MRIMNCTPAIIEFEIKPQSIYLFRSFDGQLAGIGRHLAEGLIYFDKLTNIINQLVKQHGMSFCFREEIPMFRYYYTVELQRNANYWITVTNYDNEQIFSGFFDRFVENVNNDIVDYNQWLKERLKTGKYCEGGCISLVK